MTLTTEKQERHKELADKARELRIILEQRAIAKKEYDKALEDLGNSPVGCLESMEPFLYEVRKRQYRIFDLMDKKAQILSKIKERLLEG